MKLVLYSGYDADNDDLDIAMLRLAGAKSPKIAFIPAFPSIYRDEFEYFADTFRAAGVTKFVFAPLDSSPMKKKSVNDIFTSDIIYLSGGNTFYLLSMLQKHNLLQPLREFAQKQGVLAGMSAGSIVMTPSIRTAAFPKFDRDRNTVKLKNYHALNLVGFEFFPHFDSSSTRYDRSLKNATLKAKAPLIAAPDGSGILIDGRKTHVFGPIWIYFRGKKMTLQDFGY